MASANLTEADLITIRKEVAKLANTDREHVSMVKVATDHQHRHWNHQAQQELSLQEPPGLAPPEAMRFGARTRGEILLADLLQDLLNGDDDDETAAPTAAPSASVPNTTAPNVTSIRITISGRDVDGAALTAALLKKLAAAKRVTLGGVGVLSAEAAAPPPAGSPSTQSEGEHTIRAWLSDRPWFVVALIVGCTLAMLSGVALLLVSSRNGMDPADADPALRQPLLEDQGSMDLKVQRPWAWKDRWTGNSQEPELSWPGKAGSLPQEPGLSVQVDPGIQVALENEPPITATETPMTVAEPPITFTEPPITAANALPAAVDVPIAASATAAEASPPQTPDVAVQITPDTLEAEPQVVATADALPPAPDASIAATPTADAPSAASADPPSGEAKPSANE